MKRTLSKREDILLAILAVLLLAVGYYMLIDLPVRNHILDAQSRQAAAQSELDIEMVRLAHMRDMESQLAALEGSAAVPVPDYDNSRNVMLLLNRALANTTAYNLSFQSVVFTDAIASRTVDMTFTCAGYAKMEALLHTLNTGGYRCEITALSLSDAAVSGGGSGILTGSVSGSLSVTFYEYAA